MMISRVPRSVSAWLMDSSLVTTLGVPPKDPHDDDDEDEEDEDEEEPAITPRSGFRVARSSGDGGRRCPRHWLSNGATSGATRRRIGNA
jgi:hypothetical protein